MSGNSCASALQTAPIVSDFGRLAALGAARRGGGAGGSGERRLADVEEDGHQRTWKVSLYLPICTSSPSCRRWDSIRERFT